MLKDYIIPVIRRMTIYTVRRKTGPAMLFFIILLMAGITILIAGCRKDRLKCGQAVAYTTGTRPMRTQEFKPTRGIRMIEDSTFPRNSGMAILTLC